MSARAAARLETLGFRRVYRSAREGRLVRGGTPREGTEAGTARVADLAEHDVPTCRVDERLDVVRERLRESGSDVCVVVDDQRVVLGVVEGVSADWPADTRVESVMRSNPITLRPHVPSGQLPEYLKAPATRRALVSTSDGILIGALRDPGRR